MEFTDTAKYKAIVIANGKELYRREVDLKAKNSVMKTVRAFIRSRSLSITKAVVKDEMSAELFTKTIIFDGVTVPDKPIARVVGNGSSAAAAKDFTATTQEILGIVHDDSVGSDEKEAELLKLSRDELVAAAISEGAKLKTRATKKSAIACLLGVL